jgi:lipoyl(octanoyl) transferase
VINLGQTPYKDTFTKMKQRVETAIAHPDEPYEEQLWLTEHPAVFTQGRHGKPEHIKVARSADVILDPRVSDLATLDDSSDWIPGSSPRMSPEDDGRKNLPKDVTYGDDDMAHGIPVVQTDRGGQITYHGPGQIIAYPMLKLKARKLGAKAYVCRLEQWVIELLNHYDIKGERSAGRPGIYVDDKKIAAIGLRIRNGFTYHGISLNVNMDLTPFSYINPCGYKNLGVTNMQDFVPNITLDDVTQLAMTLTPA